MDDNDILPNLGKFTQYTVEPNDAFVHDEDQAELSADSDSTEPDADQPQMDGTIRRVTNAELVSKKKDDTTGRFTELWVYNRDLHNMQHELQVRRAILNYTEIEGPRLQSPDGVQVARVWNCGNVEFLEISGLPE